MVAPFRWMISYAALRTDVPIVSSRAAVQPGQSLNRTPPTREERLAAKLRENLRRRKAQARSAAQKKEPAQAAKE